MKKYILKRLLVSALTLMIITLLLFLLLQLMPGSPFNDEKLSPEQQEVLYQKYGLDQPLYVQLGRYMANMLRGDFGVSYSIAKNISINEILAVRLPVSIRIGGQAVVVGAFIGIVLGCIAALKRNTIWDSITTVIAVLGVSIPSYVFAMGLAYIFGFKTDWFPLLYNNSHPIKSSVLPCIALCMFTIASIARFMRSEMIEVLDSDYILFAQSKGIYGPRLVICHALRNSLISVITVLGPLIVGLMTGSLVVEKLFAIPGIGSLLVTAIQSNDYNVTIALTFVYSALYIGVMLVVDILYGMIDPRIRIAKGGGQ